ncbi:hypothetical protein DUNSADRAFT_14019 [Dunaliella salina]|uniref:Encoded protein n=1 Tax=Dunaliella salina TaxID=3046 RepID=A0ABQ7H2V0_DUNSA|nr:hypothetical protein DUNSADRAFT_14019 [Dunaliella salina]|eukprot:KAF5841188.1 hypothetical protein DUNSADRAFT_14019 [Dunaliella salina]
MVKRKGSSDANINKRRDSASKACNNKDASEHCLQSETTLATPQQTPLKIPPACPNPTSHTCPNPATLTPPKPLCLEGSFMQTPACTYSTPSSQPQALSTPPTHTQPPVADKPRSTIAILNDFLENAYKLQDRAHQLWLEEQHEMKRGIALNIIYAPTSDASHHSQQWGAQQGNEDPNGCVTPGAQVIPDLGQEHLLFSPPSAKMDALFGVNLGSTPTAGQLADHTSNHLFSSPTAMGLHAFIHDGMHSARSLPGSAHAPFHSRPHILSQFHPLNHTTNPSIATASATKAPHQQQSCQEGDAHDPHLSSPQLPYTHQPQSPATQRYWQPLSSGSSPGTAPTLRCPPALGATALGSRSPLSRHQPLHASSASLASKPSRALLFHHSSGNATLHHPPHQQHGGELHTDAELSPRCGFRAAGFAPSSCSLRQQLLQQQLESSAVESPTAVLLPRAGKTQDFISCPDSPADYLLSEPSSSKHPFQQSQTQKQQQQQQGLDFLGGHTHSELRLCTTPLAKRQKR